MNDPITLEPPVNAYLASDGYTYSRESLLKAIEADPWKRSPVTKEVLRYWAYPNVIIDSLNGQISCSDPLRLYTEEFEILPAHGRWISWTVPELLSAEDTATRRRFGLPDSSFTIRAKVMRDGAKLDWLMFPPAPQEMHNDIIALAQLVGADKACANPWCLTWARIDDGKTVEEMWISTREIKTDHVH